MQDNNIKGDGVVKEDEFNVRPGISMKLAATFGRDIWRSELAVVDWVLAYTFYDRERRQIKPFMHRQTTVAVGLGYSRWTINQAFRRLVEKGVFRIKRRMRRCNRVTFGRWMRKALGKVHGTLHGNGLGNYIEKCRRESPRKKRFWRIQSENRRFDEQEKEQQAARIRQRDEKWRQEQELDPPNLEGGFGHFRKVFGDMGWGKLGETIARGWA